LGVRLWYRERDGADRKDECDYSETDHGMSLGRSQMSRLERTTFTDANRFRHACIDGTSHQSRKKSFNRFGATAV
jgi:hypothetical protein